jgi:hypothetical protein
VRYPTAWQKSAEGVVAGREVWWRPERSPTGVQGMGQEAGGMGATPQKNHWSLACAAASRGATPTTAIHGPAASMPTLRPARPVSDACVMEALVSRAHRPSALPSVKANHGSPGIESLTGGRDATPRPTAPDRATGGEAVQDAESDADAAYPRPKTRDAGCAGAQRPARLARLLWLLSNTFGVWRV